MYSYYGITVSTKINIKYLSQLLDRASKKYYEEQLWDIWKLQYPYMNEDNFINFDDFKEKYMPKEYEHTDISYEDINEEMSKVVNNYENRKKVINK